MRSRRICGGRPGPTRGDIASKQLEGQEGLENLHLFQRGLGPPAPLSVGNEGRKEAESLQRDVLEPSGAHRPERGLGAHVEDSLIAAPAHPGHDKHLNVVEGIEGVRLQKYDPPAGPCEGSHGSEGAGEMVKVVKREEAHDGIEAALELFRHVEDVGAVQGNAVASGVESAEALEQALREIDALYLDASVGQ